MISAYDALFRAAGRRYGLDWRLLAAIARQESNFDPSAVNPADPSYGIMQVSEPTARALGLTGDPRRLLAPDVGIEYGAKALADIARRHPELDAQLAVYNGGEKGGQPRAWLPDAQPWYRRAVAAYVQAVTNYYEAYQRQEPEPPLAVSHPTTALPPAGRPPVVAAGAPLGTAAGAILAILVLLAYLWWRLRA